MLPYNYLVTEDRFYKFITDDGHNYLLYFSETSLIDAENNVHTVFNISLSKNDRFNNQLFDGKYDGRIRSTVMSIVNEVFKVYDHRVMVYFCFGEDGYSRHRRIAFKQWCRDLDITIEKQDTIITFQGRSIYGALAVAKDNPLKPLILAAFNTSLEEITDKDTDEP